MSNRKAMIPAIWFENPVKDERIMDITENDYIEANIELHTEELMRTGMKEPEARRQAKAVTEWECSGQAKAVMKHLEEVA